MATTKKVVKKAPAKTAAKKPVKRAAPAPAKKVVKRAAAAPTKKVVKRAAPAPAKKVVKKAAPAKKAKPQPFNAVLRTTGAYDLPNVDAVRETAGGIEIKYTNGAISKFPLGQVLFFTETSAIVKGGVLRQYDDVAKIEEDGNKVTITFTDDSTATLIQGGDVFLEVNRGEVPGFGTADDEEAEDETDDESGDDDNEDEEQEDEEDEEETEDDESGEDGDDDEEAADDDEEEAGDDDTPAEEDGDEDWE